MTIPSKGSLIFLLVSFCVVTFVSSKAIWYDLDAFNEIDTDKIPDIPIAEELDSRNPYFEPDADDDDDVDFVEDELYYDVNGEGEGKDDSSGEDDSDDDDDDSREKREISKRELPRTPYDKDESVESEENEIKESEEELKEEDKFDAKEFEREKQREKDEYDEVSVEEEKFEGEKESEEAEEEDKVTEEEGEENAVEEEEEEKAAEEEIEEEKAVEEEDFRKDDNVKETGAEKKPELGINFPDREEFDEMPYDNSFKKHFIPVKGFFSNMWSKMKQFPKKVHHYFHGHY